MGGEDVKKLSRLGYTGVVIPNCIQVETKQTSEVFKTSEVSPKIDVILIAKANKMGFNHFVYFRRHSWGKHASVSQPLHPFRDPDPFAGHLLKGRFHRGDAAELG